MEPITFTPFPQIRNGFVHQTTGMICFSTSSMEAILKANGALAVEYDPTTGAEKAWAWAVGLDLLDIVRNVENATEFAAFMINRDLKGVVIHYADPTTVKDRQRIAQLFAGSPSSDYNGVRKLANVGSAYRVFAVKNFCYAGYGSNPGRSTSINVAGGINNTSTTAFGSIGTQTFGSSTVLGAIRVRIPGGLSWERRAAQYMHAIKEKVPSSKQAQFDDVATRSLVRMRELYDLLGYDRAGSLDVVPSFVLTSTGARLIPPIARRNVNATVTAHAMSGTGQRDAETDGYSTSQFILVSPSSVFSTAVVDPASSNTIDVNGCLAYIGGLTEVGSIDNVPLAGILGGLCGQNYGKTVQTGADLTGAQMWEMNRAAIRVTNGEDPTPRPVDAQGSPASDAQYVGLLTTQRDTFKCSGSARIRTTNWDNCLGGMSELLVVGELALNPREAKAYELFQFSLRKINGFAPSSSATYYPEWKNDPLFADQTLGLDSLLS